MREQHTDADRLTFRDSSAGGSPKWRRAIFVTETKAVPCPAQQETHEEQRNALFYTSPSSSAKAVLFAGAGVGRDEITHTERWPVVGFTGYRHACASLLEYLLVHIH